LAVHLGQLHWQATLQALELRNGAIEVTPLTTSFAAAEGPTAYHLRVLGFDGQSVTVERSVDPGAWQRLHPGVAVHVLAVDGDRRFRMQAKVCRADTFQLNEHTRVPTLVLGEFTAVASAQRRNFYRVSTAGTRLEPAQLQALADDGSALEKAAPLSPLFGALVHNLGGGGMSVQAPRSAADVARRATRYRVVLHLPTVGTPLELEARCQRFTPQPDDSTRLALTFIAGGGHGVDEVLRFCAWQQRMVLQRLRDTR
jgi:hypothetical protein